MLVFTLTLVRHGETLANKKGIIQGQQNVPLSDAGLAQARLAGTRLQNEKFTHVFSSDLNRAFMTATIIMECNRPSRTCSIQQDVRLRERNYGTFQGQKNKDLLTSAKLARMSVPEWTPPGGESLEEMNERVHFFFQDLCLEMQKLHKHEESHVESPVKSHSFKRTRTDSYCYSSSPDAVFPLEGKSNVVKTMTSTNVIKDQVNKNTCDPSLEDLVESSSPCSGYSSNTHPTLQTSCIDDLSIRSEAQTIQTSVCPNVSLSPSVEHRFSCMSSVSSGHNSFDDAEIIPPLLAEVLVVSHGGFIRQFIHYFVDKLGFKTTSGIKRAMKISPNTGISKFIISMPSLHSQDEKPRITCLLMHDAEHLVGQTFKVVDGAT